MKRAAAIVTNRGGRTCHAAIIARELGVPAVVGTGDGMSRVPDGAEVTVSCAEGDTGTIYEGMLRIRAHHGRPRGNAGGAAESHDECGQSRTRLRFLAMLPNAGVGLARLEMIIASHIGVHPNALLEYDEQDADDSSAKIDERMAGICRSGGFYVDRLVEGIATIAAAVFPKPVIVRLSDFKSNEYANLIGGARYEPHEENPMIGFRGASRYVDPAFTARVRARVPRDEKSTRGDGAGQRMGDDPVRAHLG